MNRNKFALWAAGLGTSLFGVVAMASDGAQKAAPPTASPAVSPQDVEAIARDAYLYAHPFVSMDVTMRQATNVPDASTINMRAPVNQFAHARAFPRADKKGVVRFNFDTLYSLAWLDLSAEPIVLSVPDTGGCYYLMQMLDMWSDVFAVIGSRTTGTKAGNFRDHRAWLERDSARRRRQDRRADAGRLDSRPHADQRRLRQCA